MWDSPRNRLRGGAITRPSEMRPSGARSSQRDLWRQPPTGLRKSHRPLCGLFRASRRRARITSRPTPRPSSTVPEGGRFSPGQCDRTLARAANLGGPVSGLSCAPCASAQSPGPTDHRVARAGIRGLHLHGTIGHLAADSGRTGPKAAARMKPSQRRASALSPPSALGIPQPFRRAEGGRNPRRGGCHPKEKSPTRTLLDGPVGEPIDSQPYFWRSPQRS